MRKKRNNKNDVIEKLTNPNSDFRKEMMNMWKEYIKNKKVKSV